MHLYIYKERKDIRAIVHTHARYSTAFSIMNKPIMPIVYECAYLGKTEQFPWRLMDGPEPWTWLRRWRK